MSDRLIGVDMPSDPQTVDQFESVMETIRQRAEHETQHAGQYLLRDLKGLEELGGLPPDAVRDLSWTDRGISESGDTRKEHPLRDIEYHTRLKDEIDQLANVLDRIPRDLRREAVRVWVQDPEKSNRSPDFREVLDSLDSNISNRTFFQALRDQEPDKWQEAVKTVWSELNDRGVDIP